MSRRRMAFAGECFERTCHYATRARERFDRKRRSDRSPARSTSPSASRRSLAVNGGPCSCLSRSTWSRIPTAFGKRNLPDHLAVQSQPAHALTFIQLILRKLGRVNFAIESPTVLRARWLLATVCVWGRNRPTKLVRCERHEKIGLSLLTADVCPSEHWRENFRRTPYAATCGLASSPSIFPRVFGRHRRPRRHFPRPAIR